MHALLATLWQSDSAFPSGGFAFSNGLEGAAALDPPLDRAKLAAILSATLRFRWTTADRPALLHAFHACDLARVGAIDRAFEAATVPEPFRTGSRRNGAALLISHARLGTAGAAEYRAAIAADRALGHLPVVQGWLWRRCGLDAASAVAASAYTVAAGLVNAAVRLGSVGAIEAQRALSDALGQVDVGAEFDPNAALHFASMTPRLDIAAIRHSRSDLRLFSS